VDPVLRADQDRVREPAPAGQLPPVRDRVTQGGYRPSQTAAHQAGTRADCPATRPRTVIDIRLMDRRRERPRCPVSRLLLVPPMNSQNVSTTR
jgi:hypothetical protein